MPPRKPSYPSSGAVSVVPSPHDSANLNLTPSIPMSHYRHHHQQHQQQLQQQQQHAGSNQLPRPVGDSSRTRASGSGEIVEVQGGHIVRSMGRKDRHSKVCTSKGPRDRRVRLSAHTAIQFYDVQDRLGYDRPSKAVDWLIRNAKAAIDELAELPPWQPTTVTANTANPSTATVTNATTVNHDVVSSKNAAVTVSPTAPPTASYNYASSDLLPPSLESDAIADTIKFFFPAATTVAATSSSSSGYPPDLLSRASNLTQDLRLSLQSFHDPVLIHSHSPNSAPLAFGAGQNPTVVHWNPGGGSGETFDLAAVQQQPPAAAAVQLPHAVPLHQLLVQGTAMTQRGPLQSNSPQSFRARIDPTVAIQHAELSGFASGAFPGFCIPARIHGEDEHVAGALGKPPSSTPPSSSRR